MFRLLWLLIVYKTESSRRPTLTLENSPVCVENWDDDRCKDWGH